MRIETISEESFCEQFADMAEANNIAETMSFGSLTLNRGMCPNSGVESILIHDAMSGTYLSIDSIDDVMDAFDDGKAAMTAL